MAACGTSDRACDFNRQSSLKSMGTRRLIRVYRMHLILVEIKSRRNAFDAFDRDPMAIVSKSFVSSVDVASSQASDRDPTATT